MGIRKYNVVISIHFWLVRWDCISKFPVPSDLFFYQTTLKDNIKIGCDNKKNSELTINKFNVQHFQNFTLFSIPFIKIFCLYFSIMSSFKVFFTNTESFDRTIISLFEDTLNCFFVLFSLEHLIYIICI